MGSDAFAKRVEESVTVDRNVGALKMETGE